MSNTECFLSDEVCRLCGTKKNFGKHLFSQDSLSLHLLEKITQLFAREVITIQESDTLPKFICHQCELTVNYFYDFNNMVNRVQQNMKEKQLKDEQYAAITSENIHSCHDFQNMCSEISLCVTSEGTVLCQICETQLCISDVLLLKENSHPNVSCSCMTCGHKNNLKVFIKYQNVQCPNCSVSSDVTPKQTKRKFMCDICDKQFASKGHVNRHKLIHFNRRPYLCETCGTEFNQKSTLKTHMLIHRQVMPFCCKWCCQSFRYKSSLESHLMNFHGSVTQNRNLYQCDQCKKCFINKAKYRRHYISHSGEKPYCCNICGRCFNQLANLKTHSKKHRSTQEFDNAVYEPHQIMQNNIGPIFNSCQQDFGSKVENSLDIPQNCLSQVTNIDMNQPMQDNYSEMQKTDMYYVNGSSYVMYPDEGNDIFNTSGSSKSLLPSFTTTDICL